MMNNVYYGSLLAKSKNQWTGIDQFSGQNQEQESVNWQRSVHWPSSVAKSNNQGTGKDHIAGEEQESVDGHIDQITGQGKNQGTH